MTKKQRHRIYKQVFESIKDYETLFVCVQLQFITIKNFYEPCNLEILFPEFFLFQPKILDKEGGWWPFYDKDSRLNALAFCIAMTE